MGGKGECGRPCCYQGRSIVSQRCQGHRSKEVLTVWPLVDGSQMNDDGEFVRSACCSASPSLILFAVSLDSVTVDCGLVSELGIL